MRQRPCDRRPPGFSLLKKEPKFVELVFAPDGAFAGFKPIKPAPVIPPEKENNNEHPNNDK